MRDPLHSLSVKHKLTLLFAALCLLSYGVGGVFVSRSARNALEQEIQRRIGQESRTAAQKLGQQLELLARRADDFASDGYVRERVARMAQPSGGPSVPGETGPLGDETGRGELERHLKLNKLPLEASFVGLEIVDRNGRTVASVGTCPAQGPEARPLGHATATHHGELVVSTERGVGPVQFVASPIRALTDQSPEESIGELIAWIDTRRWIARALADLDARDALLRPDATTRLSLEDRNGTSLRLVPSEESVEAWALQPVPTPDRAFAPTGRMTRSFSVPPNGWTVRMQLRTTDVFAPVSGLQSRVLVVGLVLALLSGLLLIFPMRFLVQPLHRLRDAARRIRGGDYGARVDVESSDEVGELAETFNHMADAVEQQTLRLQSTADELRDSECRLRSERDRLDGVIQSLRDALIVLDADGDPIMTNAAAAPLVEALERGNEALTSHFACSGNQEHEGCSACLMRADASHRMCVLDAGGKVFEIRATTLPPGVDGRQGRVLVGRDITTRVAQDEREIHQERLSVLGEVAAVMAHELNNPLTSIRMFAQMVADQLPADSPFQEHADVILRNTDTCRRSIRDLLGYATASAPVAADVDVHAVLDDVARFVRPLAERAQVRLSLALTAAQDQVSGDEIQLRQVFVNLIVNALQAADEPGTQLTVRSRNADNWLEIDIEDTGPGVPADVIPRLFDPFFSTKARGEGTGLGLSTARRIVELHGGRLVFAASEPGLTTFRVQLPVRSASSATSEPVVAVGERA